MKLDNTSAIVTGGASGLGAATAQALAEQGASVFALDLPAASLGLRMASGLLDVLVLSRISTPEFLRVFPKVFSGAHVDHPAVTTHRAHRVHLEATGIVGYADGERFAPLPLSCEVVPGALTVLT